MIRTFCAVLLATLVGTTVWAEDGPGTVRISGSTSVANGLVLPHKTEIETAAGIKLDVTPNSSGSGVRDLVLGRVEIGMISSDLAEILANEKNVMQEAHVEPGMLRTFHIGGSKIEFIVNEKSPIRRLTAAQLRAIYLGKVTDWKEVGGPPGEIAPVTESAHGAMRLVIEHDLLGGQRIAGDIPEMDSAPAVAEAVGRMPGSIGFISATTPVASRQGTAKIETDASLAQQFVLVTKGEPRAEASRVIDAIKQLQVTN